MKTWQKRQKMAKTAKTLTLNVLIGGLTGIKNATETETRYSILDSWSALDRVQTKEILIKIYFYSHLMIIK